jgi:hypothetical protein
LATLGSLLQLAPADVKGPSPTFEEAHLLLAFLTIGGARFTGRQALARQTGLGEGAVRTILGRLRDKGFADANASGWYLTAKGIRLHQSVGKKLTPFAAVSESQLTVGESQTAIAVRNGGMSVKSGIEQRDSAIKSGATGLTTYVIEAGHFAMPGVSDDCEKDYPSKVWSVLRRELKPRNGDAVILCGARDEVSAKLGALSAAFTLL